ncbi:MAG: XdhC family protein [Thermoanaerobaculia bacterium]|nr:MAG: XdhC family protein [Thermoanaerobaculia bacterium]MBZ0103191.1 XdhC family protein [Thermoanaerobaculia bacterium]
MTETVDSLLAASAAEGETVALATVVAGPGTGSRLLVWPAGHTFGDLGWPRLNQRVALYAEQMFDRGAGAPLIKRFAVPGAAEAEVRIDFLSGTAR